MDLSNPQQLLWLGKGGFLMHDILSDGQVLQCVAAVRAESEWDPQKWKSTVGKSELDEKFGEWLIGRQMAEVRLIFTLL